MTGVQTCALPISRRSELLQQIGVSFEVVVRSIDETPKTDELASAYVARVALKKAQAVSQEHSQRTVLAADTCISLNNSILTKPKDADDAKRMLQTLSGRKHQVYTSVAIICAERQQVVTVTTEVLFKQLSNKQIEDYVASEEPLDKAGSYAIQGFGAVLIERISGSYSSVVGLPLAETAVLLQQFNVPMWQK